MFKVYDAIVGPLEVIPLKRDKKVDIPNYQSIMDHFQKVANIQFVVNIQWVKNSQVCLKHFKAARYYFTVL